MDLAPSCSQFSPLSDESNDSDFDDVADPAAPHERDQPAYLPTPEEIAAACAEIRAGWSSHEQTRRGIGPRRAF
jgi:hypothetical protein